MVSEAQDGDYDAIFCPIESPKMVQFSKYASYIVSLSRNISHGEDLYPSIERLREPYLPHEIRIILEQIVKKRNIIHEKMTF